MFRALIEEAGAIWADDVHELLELAKVLGVPGARAPGTRTAILTCSGGDSSLGADEASRLGLELPAFEPATVERLADQLPSAATVANPLDYTAMIWGDAPALAELVVTVAGDPAIDQLLVFYDQPPGLDGAVEESWRGVREGIEAGAAAVRVPTMVASTLPELLDDDAAWRFACHGVPAAAGLRTGLRCAAALASPRGEPARLRAMAAAARRVHGGGGGDGWLAEHEAKALLRERGVRVVDGPAGGERGRGAGGVRRAGRRGGAQAERRRAAAQERAAAPSSWICARPTTCGAPTSGWLSSTAAAPRCWSSAWRPPAWR